MNIILPFFAMVSAAISPVAEVASERTRTIIIDNRGNCGEGRVAKFYQDRAEYDARKLKRELESNGEKVEIVKLHPGIVISDQKGVLIISPRC